MQDKCTHHKPPRGRTVAMESEDLAEIPLQLLWGVVQVRSPLKVQYPHL